MTKLTSAISCSDITGDPGRLDALRMAIQMEGRADRAFDRLARIAALAVDAPAALVLFADDSRLLLQGKHGTPDRLQQIDHAQVADSLCGAVLGTKRPLIVNNTQSRGAYRGLDAIKGFPVAAYLGVPIITADSHLIGVLFAVDWTTRTWNEDQISQLNDVAQAIVSEVELRAARHLYAQKARELALQNEHNLILRERQYKTEEGLLRLGFDETARERAETARRQIESILEGITDGFFALDTSMRFTYINERAEKLLHRSRGELIDTRLTDHPTPPDLVRRLKEVLHSEQQLGFEFNDVSHDTFFEILAYPSPTGISVYFHDVTERKKAIGEIERRSGELQALSRRLVEVQEEERGNIARELHDEVGQILTGLKLTLSAARRLPDATRDAQLDQAQKLVNELIGHVRNLSLDLRPAMLDDLGLLPALLWHFERYTSQTGIEITFSQTGISERFNQAVETAAYRIVQEALTNVARYAQVSEASVCVRNMGDVLRIEIEDAGVGFDPDEAIRSGRSNGVTGMRERVNLLRGTFRIESIPGEGARVRAEIPFPPDEPHTSEAFPMR